MRLLRKWLILSHRYLGIALSLLFVMWFASGIVMIYAGGMPALSPEARRAHLAAIDFSKVTLSGLEVRVFFPKVTHGSLLLEEPGLEKEQKEPSWFC